MLLHTDNLTKNYGRICALDGLNLSIRPGEVFGLLGPNGSGKSTAIRLLLGFLRPTAGAAWINGHDCWHESVAARQNVSYLPGELRLYENMNGWQLLNFLGNLRGGFDQEQVNSLIEAFDIDPSRPIAQLSSGMKRKLALVQVLAANTPLLILDEPTNTLDPTMRDALLEQLRQARANGQTVLFSSHVLSEVEEVCDRVGILQKGRLVHLQAMSELQQTRRLRIHFEKWIADLPDFGNMRNLHREHNSISLDYDGPLQPVLQWLSNQPVRELTIESIGLSAIYRYYHGTEE